MCPAGRARRGRRPIPRRLAPEVVKERRARTVRRSKAPRQRPSGRRESRLSSRAAARHAREQSAENTFDGRTDSAERSEQIVERAFGTDRSNNGIDLCPRQPTSHRLARLRWRFRGRHIEAPRQGRVRRVDQAQAFTGFGLTLRIRSKAIRMPPLDERHVALPNGRVRRPRRQTKNRVSSPDVVRSHHFITHR